MATRLSRGREPWTARSCASGRSGLWAHVEAFLHQLGTLEQLAAPVHSCPESLRKRCLHELGRRSGHHVSCILMQRVRRRSLAVSLIPLPIAHASTGCSASDMDYFWNGDANYLSPAPRQEDNWLENYRQAGEKARYEYDVNAFKRGVRSTYPDRSNYEF